MIVFSQLSRDYTLGSQTVRALQDVLVRCLPVKWWRCVGLPAQEKVPYSMCLACWILNIKVR